MGLIKYLKNREKRRKEEIRNNAERYCKSILFHLRSMGGEIELEAGLDEIDREQLRNYKEISEEVLKLTEIYFKHGFNELGERLIKGLGEYQQSLLKLEEEN